MEINEVKRMDGVCGKTRQFSFDRELTKIFFRISFTIIINEWYYCYLNKKIALLKIEIARKTKSIVSAVVAYSYLVVWVSTSSKEIKTFLGGFAKTIDV